jgi:hypothetical protein
VTLLFIVVFQLPNLINVFQPWKMGEEELKVELAEVDRAYAAKKITDLERTQQKNAIQQRHREQGRATLKWLEEWAWIANMVLPIGWPACGAAAAAEGNPLPALLAAVGLTLIGAASLRRAYTTTMRIYTGAFTAGQQARPLPTTYAPPPPTAATAAPATFFQLRLPWVSEEASAIAVAAFRSLLRAPEVKMLLLSPIIILIIFGGVMLRHSADVPAAVRPLFSFGAMAMILFTMGQLTGNQFGYDRAGFRIFVLSPVPRRELLLGKNMAVLPIVAGMLLPLTIVVQIFQPLRIDYLLALPIQFVSMFLIYCMLANLLSIFAPMPVAMGSNKPIRPKFLPVLLHMAFVGVLPMAQGPTLLPWGIDAALTSLDLDFGVPYCLILTALECVGLVFLYRFVITAQGRLLQWREQQILEVVTTKAE